MDKIDPRMIMIARGNKNELDFISKDMQNMMKLIDPDKIKEGEEDKFLSNTVMASFYTHSYTVATLAFNKMMNDRMAGKNEDRTIVDYFAVVAAEKMDEYRRSI